MIMICPKKLLKENFPNDREYTVETLVEELFLMERHIRDGSWRLCSCNPEKHLPGVAGLASEGLGFAETDDERNFMECLMSQARVFKAKIRSGKYRTQADMNAIKDWAREARHRLVAKNWSGDWVRLETGDSAEIMKSATKILNVLKNHPQNVAYHEVDINEFLVMEQQMATKIIAQLSKKYGVEPPEVIISDKCFEPMFGIYTKGKIGVCKTGVNLHVLVHEFKHHLQAENGSHFDEGEAERFAINLFKTPNHKRLYAFHNASLNDKKMIRNSKLDKKDVGVVYGGELLGYSTAYALKYLDTLRPAGFMGQPLSFWGDLIGAAGGALGAIYWRAPYSLLSALVGGYLATDLVNHIIRLAPVAVVVPTATPAAVFVPTASTAQRKGYVYDMQNMGMQNVTIKTPLVNGGRYTV